MVANTCVVSQCPLRCKALRGHMTMLLHPNTELSVDGLNKHILSKLISFQSKKID